MNIRAMNYLGLCAIKYWFDVGSPSFKMKKSMSTKRIIRVMLEKLNNSSNDFDYRNY